MGETIPALPTRPLGARGPRIGVLGLGTWSMGGAWRMGWGEQDDARSLAALEAAFSAGVDWVDTAPVYGLGAAERLLRAPLADHPEVRVFSKVGFVDDHAVDLTPASVRRQCEQSLQRLGRERIDLLQLHWPDASVPIEETWTAMAQLHDEGLVAALGISNHDPGDVERAHRLRPVDALQLRYNLLDRRAEGDLIPWAREHGVGVLAYSPLASGLLGGRFDPARLAHDDWRRRDPRFAQEADTAPAVLAVLRDAADALGVEPAAIAIAWTLATAGVTAAIGGLRDAADVPGLVAAGLLDLAPELLRALEESTSVPALAARDGRR